MYATALPAGSFRGVGSMYVAREGAGAVHSARRRALSRVGIAGLGAGLGDGPNLCTDPGWQTAHAIFDGAAGLFDVFAGRELTREGRTWGTTGAVMETASDVWTEVCTAEARANSTGSTTGTGDTVETLMARARLEMERDAAVARANQLDAASHTPPPPAPAPAGMSQQTMLLIGGGVVAVLAAVVLLRK